jgi:2-hydroxychromene-2-carboxylate isomerase
VSRLIWGGTERWHEGDKLAQATARAGLELADLDKAASSEVERIEAVIAQNQADHEAAGHWGVPTCAFRGEPFFGQDRLDVLLWRLRQHGLRER